MTNARRGIATLALVTLGCGGSKSPPASPTGWEIDLTAPSSSETPSPVPVPEAERREGPPIQRAVVEDSETIGDVVVQRLSADTVPQLRPSSPVRGPSNGVLIQIWSDFECPFCADTVPLVAELERRFGGKIRIAWRAFPLPGHAHSREAAAAALEVQKRLGPAAFWKAHDELFEKAGGGLQPSEIDEVVRASGVDPGDFRAALEAKAFEAEIDTDMAAGDAIPIEGTPSFLIGRYYLYGIADVSVYGALIEKSLAERR